MNLLSWIFLALYLWLLCGVIGTLLLIRESVFEKDPESIAVYVAFAVIGGFALLIAISVSLTLKQIKEYKNARKEKLLNREIQEYRAMEHEMRTGERVNPGHFYPFPDYYQYLHVEHVAKENKETEKDSYEIL